MTMKDKYSDIAPYFDEDLKPVLAKMVQEPGFLKLAQNMNPNITSDMLQAQAQHIHTIQDFQKLFILPIVKSILEQSADQLTFSGLEKLDKDKAYLFISNHRDILLDSTLLNYILLHNGFDSTQMAIGDNLLIEPWIENFFKLNKSFIVKRGLPGRELFKFSKRLSNYIHDTLNERKDSIWIAQREGRTKNGHDETQQGLLKMIAMAEPRNFREFMMSLHIVPIAISYQYESCDKLKAKEIYKRQFENFKKSPKSDLFSMITGIRGYKGNIHISIGEPLEKDIGNLNENIQKNKFFKAVADIIDNRIYQQYKLWDTNYIAYDLMNNCEKYSDKYTNEAKQKFIDYLDKLCEVSTKIRPYLLQIYAGPVESCEK